ncbi:hypothetical protein K7432_005306 [Basidiobolus ranarum]|uniref:Yeast cell wall synthesis Kre9/Knh1-like N-terminal domain-containing protein n=1 Tax=Basidiobolus ranarum TaxID=34480 RepID=A0ABR2WWX0_9FUNG
MLLISLFVFFAWVSLVFADITITNPVAGTIWEPGKEIVVSWMTVPGANVNPDKIDITLMVGPATAMNVATVIASGVDAKSGSTTWRVPNNLPPGNQYAIRTGDNTNVQYSHYFDIKGGSAGSASPQPSGAKTSATGSALSSSSVPTSTSNTNSQKPTLTSNSLSSATLASPSKNLTLVFTTATSQPTKIGGSATAAPPGRPISMAPKELLGSMVMSIIFIGAYFIQ